MNFPFKARVKFYLLLLYYKLISPFECQNYRLKVFYNQFTFLFATLFGLEKLASKNTNTITLKTKFGTFRIRDIAADINIAAPSFERQDVDEFLSKIQLSLSSGHHVIFIDAGASFGKFTVAVGNRFRSFKNQLSIFAFEPDHENYRLLETNIRLNNIHNVSTFHTALSNKIGKHKFYYYSPMKQIVSFQTPKQITIATTTLDSYQKRIKDIKHKEIFMKLDVEGHEVEVLQGGNKLITGNKNITLLVEDSTTFSYHKPVHYLSTHGVFLDKLTLYNSFWKLVY